MASLKKHLRDMAPRLANFAEKIKTGSPTVLRV